jgi:hypothetical protein
MRVMYYVLLYVIILCANAAVQQYLYTYDSDKFEYHEYMYDPLPYVRLPVAWSYTSGLPI